MPIHLRVGMDVLVQPTWPDQRPRRAPEAPCPRCPTGTIRHVLALARSMGSPGFDIFQCNRCGLIEWIEAADIRQRDWHVRHEERTLRN